jgi:hypothetical protein
LEKKSAPCGIFPDAYLGGAIMCRNQEARGRDVDVVVAEIADENSWSLTDLLGRDMGRIILTRPGRFMIRPSGNAMQSLAAVASKPYASLDIALAAIEEHTRGMCRRARK